MPYIQYMHILPWARLPWAPTRVMNIQEDLMKYYYAFYGSIPCIKVDVDGQLSMKHCGPHRSLGRGIELKSGA